MLKTVNIVYNDTISKEILNLFLYEKNRKKMLNENLYFANYCSLIE
jgi:hypothetical protein